MAAPPALGQQMEAHTADALPGIEVASGTSLTDAIGMNAGTLG